MLAAVIFDMDGVILDSHPIHRRAWKRFLEAVGVSVTPEELEFVTQGGKREDILRHYLGSLTAEQVRAYGHWKEALFREEALAIDPMPGLAEFINELEVAGLPIAIASCGSRQRILYVLDRLRWTSRFRVVIAGDDVVQGKPDPAIFRKAADELGVRHREVVVFEDAVAGIQGAVAAGMKAVGVASNGTAHGLLAAGAARVVPDFVNVSVTDVQLLFQRETVAMG